MNAAVVLHNITWSDLYQEVVYDVNGWKDAFQKAFPDLDFGNLPDDYDEARDYIANQDFDFVVTLF